MTKAELTSQLSTLLSSLFKAFKIIFQMYGPWLKLILIVVLAYLAFRLGRQSIVDKIESDVKRIQNVLKNRAIFTLELPERLNRLTSIKKGVIGITLFFLCAVIIKALKIKVVFLKSIPLFVLLQIFLVSFFIFLFLWTYIIFLTSQIQKGRKVNLLLNEELYALMQLVGKRGESLIRGHLCKEKFLKRKKQPAGVCAKENCKQERKYLKRRAELVEEVVMPALTFQWCSICSVRPVFEEYLPFQASLYVPGDINEGEQSQVPLKNSYLLSELGRMVEWTRRVSPCNCSKLYWMIELRQIKQFKRRDKELEDEYRMVQSRNMIRIR